MEVEESIDDATTYNNNINKDNEEDQEEVMKMPGFRFHPTDQELVGFYLRRKVEKKHISIELIKQVDIYKYEPWDLAKIGTMGEKEWYFYCMRGRKYRNSLRPNRVTGCGFWKATGIDKPIYSSSSSSSSNNNNKKNNNEEEEKTDEKNQLLCIIGLKKTLVFYCGSAGKGIKTDWMMHEFRLPPTLKINSSNHSNSNNTTQEAEIWTLCRIFKRKRSYKKCTQDLKQTTTDHADDSNHLLVNDDDHHQVLVADQSSLFTSNNNNNNNNNFLMNGNVNQIFGVGIWDELRLDGIDILNSSYLYGYESGKREI